MAMPFKTTIVDPLLHTVLEVAVVVEGSDETPVIQVDTAKNHDTSVSLSTAGVAMLEVTLQQAVRYATEAKK